MQIFLQAEHRPGLHLYAAHHLSYNFNSHQLPFITVLFSLGTHFSWLATYIYLATTTYIELLVMLPRSPISSSTRVTYKPCLSISSHEQINSNICVRGSWAQGATSAPLFDLRIFQLLFTYDFQLIWVAFRRWPGRRVVVELENGSSMHDWENNAFAVIWTKKTFSLKLSLYLYSNAYEVELCFWVNILY